MADDSDQEKTQEPSEQRVSKFKEEGKIARSSELNTLFSLGGGGVMLFVLCNKISQLLWNNFYQAFSMSGHAIRSNEWQIWALSQFAEFAKLILYFMVGTFVVSVVFSLVQTGLNVSPGVVSPKLENLSPASGIKRVFSTQTLVTLFKNILKLLVVGFIFYASLKDNLETILQLSELALAKSLMWSLQFLFHLGFKILLFFALLAILDYGYQWYKLHEEMKMTFQEVKDEMKDSEVSPHVRQKVRQIAHERSKRQIQQDVPTADVIVTNPTHFAIALRYNREKDSSPKVVAKGQDFLAKVIRELAKENGVPLYEYPELARALYKKVKVGQAVPGEFYQAVAQVLAYVYKVYKRKKNTY